MMLHGMNEIEVILIGLGALGQQLGKFALQKEGLRIVGASIFLVKARISVNS